MQLLRTERIGLHLNIAARRSTVVPHFVLKDGLQVVLSQLQASRTPKVVQDAYPDKYSDMLQVCMLLHSLSIGNSSCASVFLRRHSRVRCT